MVLLRRNIIVGLIACFVIACGPEYSFSNSVLNTSSVPADADPAVADSIANEKRAKQDALLDTVSLRFYMSKNSSNPSVFDEHGYRDGLWEVYYSNGQLASKGSYRNGIREGLFESFYENGQVKAKISYRDGLIEGSSESFYSNGKPSSKGMCLGNHLHGNWETYFPNGKLESRATFENGYPNGLYEEYYSNGNLKAKGIIENGVPVGAWEYYYENGKLKQKGSYTKQRNGYYEYDYDDD